MAVKRQTKAEQRKTFTVELPVRMGWLTTFYFQDCTVVDVGEEDQELGSISGGAGGVLGVRHKPSGRRCFIWPKDLWAALIPVLEAVPEDEWDDGWETVPEPTEADLARADAIRAAAKEKSEEDRQDHQAAFRDLSVPQPDKSEWGIYTMVEAEEVDFTLRPEHGVGYRFKNGRSAEAPEGPREVKLNVSSYVGTSPGALHYYASLDVKGLGYTDDQYLCFPGDLDAPPTVRGINIKVKKRVTRTMLADGADWKGYEVGDWTYRFETESGARKAARALFDRLFRGNWKLVDTADE